MTRKKILEYLIHLVSLFFMVNSTVGPLILFEPERESLAYLLSFEAFFMCVLAADYVLSKALKTAAYSRNLYSALELLVCLATAGFVLFEYNLASLADFGRACAIKGLSLIPAAFLAAERLFLLRKSAAAEKTEIKADLRHEKEGCACRRCCFRWN